MDNDTLTRRHPYSGTGPRRYMSKAQRACDLCRSRKSACQIDTAPPCRLCRVHGQHCEFTNRIVRKKRQPLQNASYSPPNPFNRENVSSDGRTNEPSEFTSLMQPVESTTIHMTEGPTHDDAPTAGEQLYDFSMVQGIEDADASVLGSGDHGIMEELMLSIYEGQGLSHIEANAAPGPPSLDNHQAFTSQICGLSGDMDPYVLQHYRFDARAEFVFSKLAIRSVQDTGIPVQFLLSKPELSNESKAITSLETPFTREELPELSQIVAPEIGERLIQLFSRFVNRQFPIFSEKRLPQPRAASAHLLAAIYLITQPFTTFDDYLCIEFVYSPPSPQVLFRIAWSELNNSLSQPTIQSLQAALILLLHPPLNPLLLDSTLKWTLLGMTVSMAQTLGLHLDPSMWNLPLAEVRTRRRLSWVVFALDKWFAFSFGRPSHISRENWLITELDPGDVESGDPISGAHSYAIEFSKLTTILDNVLTSLYSIRSLSTLCKDFRLTISNARPLMHDLTAWHAGLPLSLSMESTPGSKQTSDDSASLHVAYQSVKILILRALLRPFNNADHLPSELEQSDEWHAARSQIRKTASSEVDAALSLISNLQPAHYQAFWAPWLKTSFACIMNLLFLLTVVAHQTCGPDGTNAGEEYRQNRETLDRARMLFRLHAKSLDIIKFALLRIDAVFWIGWERVLGFP
ncbi:fungal-specific transcription factor domain-containing protein [Aspergillus bertholletiae]|uniref:Fungal-specific transcription factor domain-containing protein n=1 Tax=Aspergillus bertholletiae TaxID=1226010 RepID=A0A5N7BPF9_9EURO|nr:fungal-specific transcription factor domain-containing protein [Aspergillus bertholletiae]